MKNMQRKQSQNPISSFLMPSNTCQNWKNQYFPSPKTPANQRQYIVPIKQTAEQYQKLAKMYQRQNEQIQEKNKQLLEVIHHLKFRQADLLSQINNLQNYYKKLIGSDQKINNKQNENNSVLLQVTNNQLTKTNSKTSLNYPNLTSIEKQSKNGFSKTELPLKNQKQVYIKKLDEQFCKLVQLSINQKNLGKRRQLRKQLALLAAQIKKVRSSHQNIKIDGKFSAFDNKKKQMVSQIKSNKTLAPYLELNSTKLTQTNNTQLLVAHKNRLHRAKSSDFLVFDKNNKVF